MIQGQVKTVNESESNFSKKIGIESFSCLGINLSFRELKEKGFYVKEEDLDTERVFTGEKEGIGTIRLEFAMKSGDYLKKLSFFLENTDKESKGGSYQFINDKGTTSYAESKAKLGEWFTGKDNSLNPRKAKVGEDTFINFMSNLMLIDWANGGTISYDIKKILAGNVKEIKDDLKSDYAGTILVANTIKIKDDKENESFFNKAFAPGAQLKFLQNKKEFKESDIEALREKVKENEVIRLENKELPKLEKKKYKFLSALDKLILALNDAEYPCKDIYFSGLLKEYNSRDYLQTTDQVVDTSSADY